MTDQTLFPSVPIDQKVKDYHKGTQHKILEGPDCEQLVKYSKLADLLSIALVGALHLMKTSGEKKDFEEKLDASIWYGAVVSYGNLFAESEGRRLSLDYKKVFKDENDRNHHLQFIELRNTFIAHGGSNSLEDGKITLTPSQELTIFSHRQATPPQKSLEIFKALIYKTTDFVDEKIKKLRELIKENNQLK